MSILNKLNQVIKEFNSNNSINIAIDTIRVNFSKQHKLKELKSLGEWLKIDKTSSLYSRLQKEENATSGYRLKDTNIYYLNIKDKPKYRKATLIIFGIYQPHKKIDIHIIAKTLKILKNITSIDICYDNKNKPNIEAIKSLYKPKRYISNKKPTDTYYITFNLFYLSKIVIYNKAFKNNLKYSLWRIEAILNIKLQDDYLYLALFEFKEFIDRTYLLKERDLL